MISSWKDVDLWVMHLGCAIKERLIERVGHWILSLVRGGCLLGVENLGCKKRSVGSVGGEDNHVRDQGEGIERRVRCWVWGKNTLLN